MALDEVQSGKLAVLTVLTGVAASISGCSLAEIADEYLNWFDDYSLTKLQEAKDKQTGQAMEQGTALIWDTRYIYGSLAATMVPFFAIVIGAFWFAWEFARVKHVTEESCSSV